jgi:hypothetical protein
VKLVDKGRRGENTMLESRCCLDSWWGETEEKSVRWFFKLVSFAGELNGELFDTKLLVE